MVAAFPGLHWNDDPHAVVWVRFALRPWHPLPLRIASLVPAAFAAHGRILHPLRDDTGSVRWSQYAGRALDSDIRFNELVGLSDDFVRHSTLPPPWHQPDDGSLPRSVCAALATILAGFTATPEDCFFALWVGYGWSEIQQLKTERKPQLGLEHRDCYVFRGPITAAIAVESRDGWFQSPTAWWPADRAWFVATDVDGYCSYVGASADAIDALVASTDVEVLACRSDDFIDPSPYPPRRPG
ncbi:MAG TPA: hypothetical protein VH914_00865 [Acidimicrobiia bacterium]|jgi:hypothetical protein|nr:hypothetical protein [Acidimicrobiia bacterium]